MSPKIITKQVTDRVYRLEFPENLNDIRPKVTGVGCFPECDWAFTAFPMAFSFTNSDLNSDL